MNMHFWLFNNCFDFYYYLGFIVRPSACKLF